MGTDEEKSNDFTNYYGSIRLKTIKKSITARGSIIVDYIKEIKLLVNSLKETEAYKDYYRYKKVIMSNPQLLEQVNDYRKKSFQIQMEYGEGSYESYENLLNLNQEFKGLIEGTEAEEFLEAETKLSEMITEIYNCIAEEIDFDIAFLDEE